jgi:membrane associated rhomboid family serine protease
MKTAFKPFLLAFMLSLKKPALLTLFTLLAWALTLVLSVVAKLIFEEGSDNLMNYNPIINGFIHAGPSHLFMNLGLIFVFLIPQINQQYNFTQLFLITLLISLAYFPISLAAGIPAVGISGTIYFMMARACLHKKNRLLFVFFALMFGYEIAHLNAASDGVAHGVHLIGMLFGFISLRRNKNAVRSLEHPEEHNALS